MIKDTSGRTARSNNVLIGNGGVRSAISVEGLSYSYPGQKKPAIDDVKSLIRKLRDEGKTIVLTTHNMNDVDELCDRVSFMVEGRFVALDAPDVLNARFGRRVVAVHYRQGNDLHCEEFDLERLASNRRFLQVLQTREVQKIHSQEATLDQVFNEVTGVKLGEA